MDAVFWALFLTAFFTLAWKSNLVASSLSKHKRHQQILCSDVLVSAQHLVVTFCWTKTMQDGARPLIVPYVVIPGSSLCPVHAYQNMLNLVPAPTSSPAFVVPYRRSVRPVTYKDYMVVLRCLIGHFGLNPSFFSSHSFRHGGATFAFHSGVPEQLIKVQGDWASDAYTRYLHCSVDSLLTVAAQVHDYVLLNE